MEYELEIKDLVGDRIKCSSGPWRGKGEYFIYILIERDDTDADVALTPDQAEKLGMWLLNRATRLRNAGKCGK